MSTPTFFRFGIRTILSLFLAGVLTDRVADFLGVVKKQPSIKIRSQDQNAGGSRDGGLRVMSDLLTAFKRIDAVFAINGPTAIGCDLAAKQAQRKEFFIVGVDCEWSWARRLIHLVFL